MSKRLVSVAVLVLLSTFLTVSTVNASPRCVSTWFGDAYEVRVTYYTGLEEGEWYGSQGRRLYEGACAAWSGYYGDTIVLWTMRNGGPEVVGYFECLDTGASWWSKPFDESGSRLDLWFYSSEDAREFFSEYGDTLYVTAISSVG